MKPLLRWPDPDGKYRLREIPSGELVKTNPKFLTTKHTKYTNASDMKSERRALVEFAFIVLAFCIGVVVMFFTR